MPKVTPSSLPISALFGLAKPSGPTSMSVINDVKLLCTRSKLFLTEAQLEKAEKETKRRKKSRDLIKIGQGGTLDPLADGVLVVGIGRGTKKLSEFLDCTKEYYTTCLLGCETDSYDSQGASVRQAPWKHVTREKVEGELDRFRGSIKQTPPIFSALKMDGRPLYEYARKGIPLPRAIEPREVTVHSLELVEWKGSEHTYRWPEKQFTDEEKQAMEKALENVEPDASLKNEPEAAEEASEQAPTAFVLKMTVSGGTYVRSIVHDLAHAVGSAGHVVTLTRSRQGRFALTKEADDEKSFDCLPWDLLERAAKDAGPKDEEGWTEWERELLKRIDIVDS